VADAASCPGRSETAHHEHAAHLPSRSPLDGASQRSPVPPPRGHRGVLTTRTAWTCRLPRRAATSGCHVAEHARGPNRPGAPSAQRAAPRRRCACCAATYRAPLPGGAAGSARATTRHSSSPRSASRDGSRDRADHPNPGRG